MRFFLSRYPTQSNALVGNTIGVAGSANYNDSYNWYPGMALTDVGAYGANSDSFYGTNDQAGNVWEWNDAVSGSSRGLRGGSWVGTGVIGLGSWSRDGTVPSFEGNVYGFRIASVPEPTSVFLAIFGSGMLVTRRKR
jgi:formylglycine-generating enzyme required for sulfatase activity